MHTEIQTTTFPEHSCGFRESVELFDSIKIFRKHLYSQIGVIWFSNLMPILPNHLHFYSHRCRLISGRNKHKPGPTRDHSSLPQKRKTSCAAAVTNIAAKKSEWWQETQEPAEHRASPLAERELSCTRASALRVRWLLCCQHRPAPKCFPPVQL